MDKTIFIVGNETETFHTWKQYIRRLACIIILAKTMTLHFMGHTDTSKCQTEFTRMTNA